ncbi:MAG: ATP-binding protein [Phaeodactylibacter sp.]|nr:ATP-binding protein [Phaeodactylibacter sp.]
MEARSIAYLESALGHLSTVIQGRMMEFFDGKRFRGLPALGGNGVQTPLSEFVQQHQLSGEEYLLLVLGLAPHVYPQFLDQVITESLPKAGDFPQIGGVRGKQFRGFIPTGETAIFLLAGTDLQRRLEVQQLFNEEHFFAKRKIFWLEEPPAGEPRMSGKVVLSQEYVDLFTTGKVSRPRFSMNFPAKLIETQLEWSDLVLNGQTMEQIKELETWVKYGPVLYNDWGMGRKLKPGYRALFHGPPGTGKTLTASLLGKYTGRDVYKVDLSMVVSKYIGETEKNLHHLFAKAESKDWILFFDEADALFGKRTSVKDAHDKYANQEVSYLLQRIEEYNGLTILASNFKNNIDEAFNRRFQSIIHFPMPKAAERLRIWEQAFPEKVGLAPEVDLKRVANRYELSGASIMNVVQFCCLQALERRGSEITAPDVLAGIQKEFSKEGKVLH